MIRFSCPKCKQQMDTGDNKAGTKLFCPKCGQKLQVPTPPPAPPPDPRKKTVLGELLPPAADRTKKTVLADLVGLPVPPDAPEQKRPPETPELPDGTYLISCVHCKNTSRVKKENMTKAVRCPTCKKVFMALLNF